MNLSEDLSVDKELFSEMSMKENIVNWSFSVSLRLFSGVYEGKYLPIFSIFIFQYSVYKTKIDFIKI